MLLTDVIIEFKTLKAIIKAMHHLLQCWQDNTQQQDHHTKLSILNAPGNLV
jgi:hypothetical protein